MDKRIRGNRPTFSDYRLPHDHIRVYRIKDLQADARVFIELAALVNKCHGLCRLSGKPFRQLLEQLLSDDRLASRLRRSSLGGKQNY
jgi:hypothetical protein